MAKPEPPKIDKVLWAIFVGGMLTLVGVGSMLLVAVQGVK